MARSSHPQPRLVAAKERLLPGGSSLMAKEFNADELQNLGLNIVDAMYPERNLNVTP